MCARIRFQFKKKRDFFLLFFNFIYIFFKIGKRCIIFIFVLNRCPKYETRWVLVRRDLFSRLLLYRRRHSIYSCVVHLSRFYVRFFLSSLFLSLLSDQSFGNYGRERICFFVVIFRRMRRVYKRRRRRRRGEERTIIDPVNMCAADTIRERKKRKTHSHA